jgi:hypothetical protein
MQKKTNLVCVQKLSQIDTLLSGRLFAHSEKLDEILDRRGEIAEVERLPTKGEVNVILYQGPSFARKDVQGVNVATISMPSLREPKKSSLQLPHENETMMKRVKIVVIRCMDKRTWPLLL